MLSAATSVVLFLISVKILPQKEGQDVPAIISKISNVFEVHRTDVTFLNKFKVDGEATVLAVVQVSNINTLERIVSRLQKLGAIDIECQPVIYFETFARNSLGVAENITNIATGVLQKDSIYWLNVKVEYYGKTRAELIDIWRQEAEIGLTLRSRRELNFEAYKNLAERELNAFINSPVPEELDQRLNELPLFVRNGANIFVKSKKLNFLDEYVHSIYFRSLD